MMVSLALVGAILVCLAGQAFFSGSEMAMVSADRLRLETGATEGKASAKLVLRLLSSEERLLGTCLIGTNLSLVVGTVLVTQFMAINHLDPAPVWALLYVPIALICGETLPKNVLQFHSDRVAPVVAYPLRFAQILFWPALVVVGAWSHLLDSIAGQSDREPVRREEIMDLLEDSDDGSTDIDEGERRFITKLFELTETPVEDVMTPLVDLTAIEDTATIEEAAALAVQSGHSRLPVYRERIDNIVGVIHAPSLLFSNQTLLPVSDLAEPASFVPEQKKVGELLMEMRHRRDSMVVVVDEYGGSVGLATIEDLLEEVVGEIHDEKDTAEPSIVQLSADEWRIPARTDTDEREEQCKFPIPDGDYETVAGMILAHIGRIPAQGETVQVAGAQFFIDEASERAILAVRMRWRAPDQSPETKSSNPG